MHTCPKVHYICASVSALLLSRLQHTQLPPRAKAHIQPYWDNAQIALLNRAPSVKRQWMGGGFMYWLSKSEKSLYFNGLQFYIQFPIKPNQTILNPFSFFSLWIYFENSPLFLSVYFHLICSKLLDTVLGFRSIYVPLITVSLVSGTLGYISLKSVLLLFTDGASLHGFTLKIWQYSNFVFSFFYSQNSFVFSILRPSLEMNHWEANLESQRQGRERQTSKPSLKRSGITSTFLGQNKMAVTIKISFCSV